MRLNPGEATREPRTPRDPVDLAIVGGGITGAGIASLAARRGLSVALVERRNGLDIVAINRLVRPAPTP